MEDLVGPYTGEYGDFAPIVPWMGMFWSDNDVARNQGLQLTIMLSDGPPASGTRNWCNIYTYIMQSMPQVQLSPLQQMLMIGLGILRS